MSATYPIRTISTAPERLVEDGQFNLGCFEHTPIKDANLLDIPSTYSFIPSWLKYIQLREWQAYQVKNEEYFILIALYNAKKMSLVHFIIYNYQTKQKLKYEKQLSTWSSNMVIPNTLYDSHAYYHSDDISIDVFHDIPSKKLEIKVKIQNFCDPLLPDIEAEFYGLHDVNRYKPMVVCNPFSSSNDSVMYSHKCLMPCHGKLVIHHRHGHVIDEDSTLNTANKINNQTMILFEEDKAELIIDEHKGYYPYMTRYDWVTGLGRDNNNNGKLMGFNLTNNQVIEQEKYNENCLWYDGELHPLPPIQMTRPDGHTGLWIIKDQYDIVNIEFQPVTHTSVHLNYIIAYSKYEGPYGFFTGYLRKMNGEKVIVDGLIGMGEDFYLRL
jgi:hypothetical protein